MPAPAQASSPQHGHGGFLNAGVAAELEAKDGGQLDAFGLARAVEAGWLIPGGSIFLFELGLRGAVMEEQASTRSEVGAFGGARLALLRNAFAGLMPYLRGGLSVARLRIDEKDRLGLGSYFGAGVAWEIWAGVSLAVEGSAHPRIAPFTLSLGGSVTIAVQSF